MNVKTLIFCLLAAMPMIGSSAHAQVQHLTLSSIAIPPQSNGIIGRVGVGRLNSNGDLEAIRYSTDGVPSTSWPVNNLTRRGNQILFTSDARFLGAMDARNLGVVVQDLNVIVVDIIDRRTGEIHVFRSYPVEPIPFFEINRKKSELQATCDPANPPNRLTRRKHISLTAPGVEGSFEMTFIQEVRPSPGPTIQIKIPRIIRGGAATSTVLIKAYSDQFFVGSTYIDLPSPLPGPSSLQFSPISPNAPKKDFVDDGRITFTDLAKLEFVEVLYEDDTAFANGDVEERLLGAMYFPAEPSGAVPDYKTILNGDYEFHVVYWRAKCGEPFLYTRDDAVIGVMAEIGGGNASRDMFGETRDHNTLETAGWFKDPTSGATVSYNVALGAPLDHPGNVITGLTSWGTGDGDPIANEGSSTETGETRTYAYQSFGNGKLRLSIAKRDADKKGQVVIVGTEFRIKSLNSATNYGVKKTGSWNGFKRQLLHGYLDLGAALDDSNVSWFDKLSGRGTGYGYLDAYLIDLPYGIAE